jgi:hypothetical protein
VTTVSYRNIERLSRTARDATIDAAKPDRPDQSHDQDQSIYGEQNLFLASGSGTNSHLAGLERCHVWSGCTGDGHAYDREALIGWIVWGFQCGMETFGSGDESEIWRCLGPQLAAALQIKLIEIKTILKSRFNVESMTHQGGSAILGQAGRD